MTCYHFTTNTSTLQSSKSIHSWGDLLDIQTGWQLGYQRSLWLVPRPVYHQTFTLHYYYYYEMFLLTGQYVDIIWRIVGPIPNPASTLVTFRNCLFSISHDVRTASQTTSSECWTEPSYFQWEMLQCLINYCTIMNIIKIGLQHLFSKKMEWCLMIHTDTYKFTHFTW